MRNKWAVIFPIWPGVPREDVKKFSFILGSSSCIQRYVVRLRS